MCWAIAQRNFWYLKALIRVDPQTAFIPWQCCLVLHVCFVAHICGLGPSLCFLADFWAQMCGVGWIMGWISMAAPVVGCYVSQCRCRWGGMVYPVPRINGALQGFLLSQFFAHCHEFLINFTKRGNTGQWLSDSETILALEGPEICSTCFCTSCPALRLKYLPQLGLKPQHCCIKDSCSEIQLIQ